jgi:DNA-binding transcriptional ArsR family regulator
MLDGFDVMKKDVCETTIIDERKVRQAKKNMVDQKLTSSLVGIFKALSDPTRIKIFNALFCGELCVCDLAKVIGQSQSATSHQLRWLRDMNLVKHKRVGKTVLYSLADQHVETLFNVTVEHLKHDKA